MTKNEWLGGLMMLIGLVLFVFCIPTLIIGGIGLAPVAGVLIIMGSDRFNKK